jgi:AraC family transcriptional regulator
MKATSAPAHGGLAPWQGRRVKEFLDANLDGDISVLLLAGACSLLRKHFSRAVR